MRELCYLLGFIFFIVFMAWAVRQDSENIVARKKAAAECFEKTHATECWK